MIIDEGDVIDLGDRLFEVFYFFGYSLGSIGLWEEWMGILFLGDVVYDVNFLDDLLGSDKSVYCKMMECLLELLVIVVYGGYDESFGCEWLREIVGVYFDGWKLEYVY